LGLKAQNIKGEIFVKDNSLLYLNQVYVTNLNTMKTVLSDYNGKFSIEGNLGETLRFTSIITARKDITINQEILNTPSNLIELKLDYYDIEEVKIASFHPTGNLRKDVLSLKKKDYNFEIKKMIGLPQAKGDGLPRQLPVASLANGGLSFSLESIYDILSGERKKKERYQKFEMMNTSIKNIQNYFGDDYFIKLKIPKPLISNFLQFIYTSDNIQNIVDTGNYEAVKFYMEKYNPIYQKRLRASNLMKLVE
jgi:hypothetical protein